MTRPASFSVTHLVLLTALGLSACGSGGPRQLQSVTLSPSSADAKNFPNGQVQFTATGRFSTPPSPVHLTNRDVLWCVGGPANATNPTAGLCSGNIAPLATINQNGLAQCSAVFQGTVNILAGTALPPMNPDVGPQLKIFGAAQLTCP